MAVVVDRYVVRVVEMEFLQVHVIVREQSIMDAAAVVALSMLDVDAVNLVHLDVIQYAVVQLWIMAVGVVVAQSMLDVVAVNLVRLDVIQLVVVRLLITDAVAVVQQSMLDVDAE